MVGTSRLFLFIRRLQPPGDVTGADGR
jgi:hypothetical protein